MREVGRALDSTQTASFPAILDLDSRKRAEAAGCRLGVDTVAGWMASVERKRTVKNMKVIHDERHMEIKHDHGREVSDLKFEYMTNSYHFCMQNKCGHKILNLH